MSTIADFNHIEDCDKIGSECVNAFVEAYIEEEEPSIIHVDSSWGNSEVDIAPAVKTEETLTTMYLSPTESPNCLVYEPERGDNVCIHGDDLSRIISMQKLKDVDQTQTISDGDVYIFDGTTGAFVPYDLKTVVTNLNTAITNLSAAVTSLQNRVYNLELKLTPPADAPQGVKVVFGNTNLYADTNAVVDSTGTATTLDKTHGLYTHLLANDAYGDQLFS